MIGDISLTTNIYIITGYTDMRKSIDGRYALVMEKLNEEPPYICSVITAIAYETPISGDKKTAWFNVYYQHVYSAAYTYHWIKT